MSIDYYKEEIEKQAGLGSVVAGIGKSILPKVTQFAGSSLGKRMLTGASVGAAVKGLTYNGNEGNAGRLKSMLGGAGAGALGGALLNSNNLAKAQNAITNVGSKFNGATAGATVSNASKIQKPIGLLGADNSPLRNASKYKNIINGVSYSVS